ncbi:MAG: hypothetical protein ACOX2N_03500 [Peptococcia bacterium]
MIRYVDFLWKKSDALRDDPVFPKEKDIILDEKIEYILQQFCKKRIFSAGVYRVPEEIMQELKRDKYSPDTLQKLADSIVAHTGVYNSVEVIVRDTKLGDISGLYEVYGEANWQIHLYKDNSYSILQIIAILIHECVHNFLFYYDLELYPEEENEILTDVTAVFLGFGQLLMEGYKPIKEISDSHFQYHGIEFEVSRWRVGYLNLNDLAYVIKKYEEYIAKYTREDVIYGKKLL